MKWSTHCTEHIRRTVFSKPVVLRSSNQSVPARHFDSQKDCRMYLKSIGITISKCRMSRICHSGKSYEGFRIDLVSAESDIVATLPNEVWKMFHDEGRKRIQYFISNLGRVKTVSQTGRERLLSTPSSQGYKHMSLYFGSKRMNRRVHQLVAEHFVENPLKYNMIDHIDSNSLNNIATNLRWIKDPSHNAQNVETRRKLSEARLINVRVEQIDKDSGRVIKIWERPNILHKEYGYNVTFIMRVCKGERRFAHGFLWRFCDK